jgi:hypothetical protein
MDTVSEERSRFIEGCRGSPWLATLLPANWRFGLNGRYRVAACPPGWSCDGQPLTMAEVREKVIERVEDTLCFTPDREEVAALILVLRHAHTPDKVDRFLHTHYHCDPAGILEMAEVYAAWRAWPHRWRISERRLMALMRARGYEVVGDDEFALLGGWSLPPGSFLPDHSKP